MERVSRNFSKNRLQPYKLLTLLLYGTYEWAEWLDSERVMVKTGPLSRLIGVSYGKLREHIDWLVSRGYLTYASTDHGKALLIVRRPPDRGTTPAPQAVAPEPDFEAQVEAVLADPQMQVILDDLAKTDVAPQKQVDKKKVIW